MRAGGQPRREPLEQRAELVEVLEIGGVVGADGRAAVRRRLDEALGLEHEQRLANRRPADAELPRELLLLQALARLDPPVDDRLADQLGRGGARALRQRRSAVVEDPRHGEHHTVCNALPSRPGATRVGMTRAGRRPGSSSSASGMHAASTA